MYLCREGYGTVKYLSGQVHIPLKLSEIVGSSIFQLSFGIDTLQIVGMGMSPHKKVYFEYSLSRFASLDCIFQKQDDWLKYSRLFILYVLETLNFQFFSGKVAAYNKVKLWVFTGEYRNYRTADKLREELETNYFNKDDLPKNLETEFGKLKGMSNYLVYIIQILSMASLLIHNL